MQFKDKNNVEEIFEFENNKPADVLSLYTR